MASRSLFWALSLRYCQSTRSGCWLPSRTGPYTMPCPFRSSTQRWCSILARSSISAVGEGKMRIGGGLWDDDTADGVELDTDICGLRQVGLLEVVRQIFPRPHGQVDKRRFAAGLAVPDVSLMDGPGQLVGEVFSYPSGHACLLDDLEYGQPSLRIIQQGLLGAQDRPERRGLAHADHHVVGAGGHGLGRGQASVQRVVVVREADERQRWFVARGPLRCIVVAGYRAIPADYRKPVQEVAGGFRCLHRECSPAAASRPDAGAARSHGARHGPVGRNRRSPPARAGSRRAPGGAYPAAPWPRCPRRRRSRGGNWSRLWPRCAGPCSAVEISASRT